MTCDCETPSVWDSCHRVARKHHACCECRRPIQPGSRYREDHGLWDGSWATYRTCGRCERVCQALKREAGCCLAYGDMRDALRQRIYDRHRWARVWGGSR